jgi:MFS superfamily sulfate permease-like transporter
MKNFFSDLKAGIVVFLVALPLCLGIALACKAPLFSGLLAGIIGGIFVTIFSGSVLSVSGPAAGLTAIVLSSVATLGSFEVFMAAVLFAGAIQIILGMIKAGGIANYIPNAVIKGMLAGIGIILIIKQIPHLFGYDKDPEGDFEFIQADGHNTFSDLLEMFNFITPGAVVVGIISVVILILAEKKFYKSNKLLSLLPAPLLVVVVGIILNIFLSQTDFFRINPEHIVALPRIKNFEDVKTIINLPDFSNIFTSDFWFVVLTLSVVASLESLLSIEATDRLDPEKRYSNANKELIAQGVGNMICGSIGALPVTAVIIRSSANISAGAKTKLSTIIHALLLCICIILIPGVLMLIPNASLAAILIMTGYKLTKPMMYKDYFRKGYDQLLPFITTIIIMLLSDLLWGVTAGIIVAVIFIIRKSIKSSFHTASSIIDDQLHHLIKLPQYVTFFNKGFLINYLRSVKPGNKVIIDGSINESIDQDVKEVIGEFVENSKIKNTETTLIKVNLNGYGKY